MKGDYCLLFHDWEKWIEPYLTEARQITPVGSFSAGTALFQTRACKRCGAVQARIVEAKA
jgi:hypothetical protein